MNEASVSQIFIMIQHWPWESLIDRIASYLSQTSILINFNYNIVKIYYIYISVTIISGYIQNFKLAIFKIYDLAGISFSNFIISSFDTYQVLSGFYIVSGNYKPSQKADLQISRLNSASYYSPTILLTHTPTD